ncbi:hypothetical protein DRE_02836 [Drechslerella stenobrocha 248]|uniref:Sensitive to high expression protein 9, mitochondrial n=1 Tax=Drechslerella stenobrocha 248 TaxID=1043628 RepID=W7HWP2_9PEZI|nr:hypothetical protein DRE_02836 [Drechslerella stenobrocha 248]
MDSKLASTKATVQQAKAAYKAAIARRSDSQKEVNELLQRKNLWTPTDLERFTELYRSDHANEQAEIQAQNQLSEVEKEVDGVSNELSRSILKRYHEEQVWSDKIRRASTWGTWMLMGINIALFVVVQLGLEPWKRRRLVNNFEEKVRGMLKEEKEMILMAQGGAVAVGAVVPDAAVPNAAILDAKVPDAIPDATTPAAIVVDVVTPDEVIQVEEGMVTDGEGSPGEGEYQRALADYTEGEEEAAEDDDEEGMNVLEVVMHRLRRYFREDLVVVSQLDISMWVIEGFVTGAISAITVLATAMLLDWD